jgi:hypothetical protein
MAESYWSRLKEDWKKDQDKRKKEEERLAKIKKGFVWYSVRTLYWIIIILLLYDWIYVKNEGISSIIGIIWIILALPLFILAIIHLNIYKKDGRGEAIWALIISGIALWVFLSSISGINGTEWQVVTDTAISLESNHAYKVFGTTYGEIIPTKYEVQSDKPINIYWAKTEADCDLALNGLEFMHYSDCSSQIENVYKFTSIECNVPSDSGLCVINLGQESAKINVIIEKKE